MKNSEYQAAVKFHEGTSHPNGFLMNRAHFYSPALEPLKEKRYLDLEPIPLPQPVPESGFPALEALSADLPDPGQPAAPDFDTIASILHYSAGITKKIDYPGYGSYTFRAAACTGALYHIELYLVCAGLSGLSAGVYHYNPSEHALKMLRQGDFRRVLLEASGNEPSLESAPAALVYTDVFWRNAVKYQARAYRHAFWDSGTIIANTLAEASAWKIPARLIAGFFDDPVNRLLDLDVEREASVALVSLGADPGSRPPPAPELTQLNLRVQPIDVRETVLPAITEIHAASSLSSPGEVRDWREKAGSLEFQTSYPDDLIALEPLEKGSETHDSIEKVIRRRGSTRRFSNQPVSFQQFSTILANSTRGIPADFPCLLRPYIIANRIEDLDPGTYFYHRSKESLELLAGGNFRNQAGQLALGQSLAADAAANIYFLADLESILGALGNRGYRAAQLDAAIAAGKVYLSAYALRLGATGLTFFDDAVTGFFSPHAEGLSVMFLIVVGVPMRRASI